MIFGFHPSDSLVMLTFDAARTFPLFRFPELFCGFDRTDTGVPVAYPVACAPQAWAAASPFLLFRALLGISANAPAHELQIVRPMLPRPLRSLTVTGLRVGDATVDLLFHRWRGSTSAARSAAVSFHSAPASGTSSACLIVPGTSSLMVIFAKTVPISSYDFTGLVFL